MATRHAKQGIRSKKIGSSKTIASAQVWTLQYRSIARCEIFVAGAPPIPQGGEMQETRFLIPPDGGRGFRHAVLVYEVRETGQNAAVDQKTVAILADDLWHQLKPTTAKPKRHMMVDKQLAQLSGIMDTVMNDYTHVATDAWAVSKVHRLRQLAISVQRQAQLQRKTKLF